MRMRIAREKIMKKFLLLWDEYRGVSVPTKIELCCDFKYGVRMKDIRAATRQPKRNYVICSGWECASHDNRKRGKVEEKKFRICSILCH